jgi:ubiquinone/menaquinone biosynthesis C-methylase UbiE
MLNNYDAVAGSYDFLSKLIFGNAIKQSQVCLLPFIPPRSSILIAGGGTGWILEELAKIHPTGLKIVYVEVSSKMIALTGKRNPGQNNISLICLPIEAYTTSQQFDVIITPYLFDNFTEQEATQNFYNLHHMLKPHGQWLFADFYISDKTAKQWQKMLLKTMYLFFSFVCNIQSRQLIDMNIYFEQNGYKIKYVHFYYRKFIRSCVWKKI